MIDRKQLEEEYLNYLQLNGIKNPNNDTFKFFLRSRNEIIPFSLFQAISKNNLNKKMKLILSNH